MSQPFVSDDEPQMLHRLSAAGSPPPWRSFIEGRDHLSGDDVILIGDAPYGPGTDMYVTLDGKPASEADQDLIAAARTFLPRLLDEIERLRSESGR